MVPSNVCPSSTQGPAPRHRGPKEERKEYALKDFESDAAAVLKDASSLSWEDVEKFMAENL